MQRGIGAAAGLVAVLGLAVAGCGAAGNGGSGKAAKHPSSAAASVSPAPSRTPGEEASDENGALVPDNLDIPTSTPGSGGKVRGPVLGADISWPQCPKGMGIPQKRSEGLPMPDDSARFVVIGLTNGPSFVTNPCLADQVSWARSRHRWTGAYSVVSYPDAKTLARYRDKGPYDGSTTAGALSNVGYQSAQFNIAAMKKVGLLPPYVWLDIESVPHFEWSSDTAANAAVVRGAVRGYESKGFGVGFYSVPSLWQGVVGDLTLHRPEWRAAGQTSAAEATNRCEDDDAWSFNGGEGVLGQWIEDHRDHDLTCPPKSGTSDLAKWFRRL